jgi:hypothetical protein
MRSTHALAVLASAALSLLATPALAGGCDHPYFPIKQGQTLVYAYPEAGMQVTMVVSKVDGNHFTYDVTTKIGAGGTTSSVVHGECTAQGFSSDAAAGSRSATSRVVTRTGTQFGPASQMKVGGTWTSGTTSENESPQHGMVRSETTSTSKVVAKERVKVPAGDYDTLKIESVTEMKNTMTGPGAAQAAKAGFGTITVKGTMWIAEGVGLVKTATAGDDGALTPGMELVSFHK